MPEVPCLIPHINGEVDIIGVMAIAVGFYGDEEITRLAVFAEELWSFKACHFLGMSILVADKSGHHQWFLG